MESLLASDGATAIIERINKLRADSVPLWGKMNVSQMLAHCRRAIEVPLGEHRLKRNILMKLFGGLVKKTVLSDKPYKRGLPTDASFVIKDTPDFEPEKQRLIQAIRKFASTDPADLDRRRHPYFGRMTAREWDKSQGKHLDHHLQQFGV